MNPPNPKGKRQIKVNAMAYAHMVRLMLDGTYTCAELAQETGLHYVTVLQYAREMHKVGAAHISGWEADARGRDLSKIYKIGEGKDKPRRKLTQAARQIAYRAKKKQRKLLEMLCSAPSAERVPAPCQHEQPEMV
jgi:hypothetical protein